MKKIFVLSAIAAMVLASCTTKETIETPVNNPVEKGKVTLKATMPSFESTKASVDASGNFAWASGDKIDVVYTKAGSPDKTYEFTYNGTDFEYVGTIEEGYAVSAAYYPVGYAGTASTQNFASLEDAAKGFQMTATVNAGVLEFAHDNAMLHVTVNNVPSFAKALTVGGSTITLSSPATSIEAFVPVAPAASAKLSIALSDGTNDIISKSSKNAAAIAAAKMYPLNDLTVGPVVLIKNDVYNEMHTLAGKDWTTVNDAGSEICFYSSYGETEYCSWSSSTTNLKPITIGGVDYGYFVYPASASGNKVKIEIVNKDGGNGYPRTVRYFTLSDGETYFTVGYGLGLRKSDETFCYAFYEGGNSADNSINIYAFNPEAFGSWEDSKYATGTSTMWENGRVIRYYLTNGFVSTSQFIIRKNDTTTKLIEDDLPKNTDPSVNFIDGNCAIGFWKNGDSYWWYSPSTIIEYLQKGPWM